MKPNPGVPVTMKFVKRTIPSTGIPIPSWILIGLALIFLDNLILMATFSDFTICLYQSAYIPNTVSGKCRLLWGSATGAGPESCVEIIDSSIDVLASAP